MVSREMIEIILKAEDQASQVFKQNEQNVKKFADAAKKGMNEASNASDKYNQKLHKTISDVNKVGNEGSKSFRELSKAEQDAVTKFNMLNPKLQTTLQAIREVGSTNMFPDSNEALSAFSQLNNLTNSWSGSLDYAKTKMSLLGNNTTTLRGKIQTTGMAIQTYLGTKWDPIKTKISSVAQSITGKIGGAIDAVKGKLSGLSNKFGQFANGIKKSGGGLGFLSNAASMAAGMIGYDLFNSFVQSGREAINASSRFDYFAGRMRLTDSQINTFKTDVSDLQNEFRKVDMTAVAATAEEMSVKYGLQYDTLKGLTEASAVAASAFVSDGNTQENAILAVSDALDGQWKRMQEIGVTQEMLKNNGWNGDLNDKKGLIDALNKSLEDLGHTQTAKDITNLDDAFAALSVSGGLLLRDILVPMTPSLISIMEGAMGVIGVIRELVGGFQSAWTSMPDWQKAALLITGVALAVSALAIAIKLNLIPGVIGSALSFITAEASSFIWMVTNMGLTTTLGFLATAIWSAVAATLAFVAPIVIAVAVIGALVFAIYEVGKAFGWWHDAGSMIDAIKKNIGRLWDAFINHPDVQAIIQTIGAAWQWLNTALKPVVDWLGGIWDEMFPESAKGKVDGTRAIINAIGLAFQLLTMPIRGAISILQALYNFALPIGQGIYNALKPIVCILLGCSPGIVPALEKVQEVFGSVWNAIAGFIGGVITTIVSAIQPIIDILSAIVNFYLSSFIYAWQTLTMVFNIVYTAVNTIINIFSLFLSGQINLQTMLTMVWSTLSQMFALVLSTIINRVRSWASNLLSRAISAGRGFVNGVIRFVSGLPGRFGSYLTSIIGRIASAGAAWISTGISKASAMVTGVINHVSQLPGKVYTEFMNIGSRIMQAGSDLVKKATEIGKNIVDGLLNAMGIHSPGIIQESVVTEFVNMIGRVANKVKSAYDTAKSIGNAIVEGFGNPTLETNTENILPNEDALKTSIGVNAQLSTPIESATTTMDTSAVANGNTEVIGSYDNLAAMTGSALQNMVDRDKLAYETIRTNDANTLTQMSTNLAQKMGAMTNNVSSNMNSIVSKNKSGMNTVNNITKSNLNSIVSKTKSANTQMIKSWGVMKEGIISAADKIKSESTTHFNKLSSTIGTFYGKLKNPSRWGAGSPITRTHNTSSSNGFSKITNAIKAAQLPKYLSLGQIKHNPSIISSNFGDYVTKDKRNNLFNVADLLSYGAIQVVGKGAGAYSDIPSPNVKLIKDTSNEWDMKGPLVGKFQTNHGFKVKEFLTGIPKISFDVFRGIAEDVFGQTNYEFYYDDDHHGNWVNAFNAGSMNCKHGAEALIALAQTMGLSGSMVHGHWTDSSGTYGHYFANIAGHKMDVTGWQQRRTWTPSASAGPAPKGYGFKDLIKQLIDIFKDDPDNPSSSGAQVNNSEDNTMKGEFTFIHDFKNLPEGITAEEVVALIEESTTNDNFIKKLAQNPVFQKWDLKTKTVLENKNNRARGV